MQFSRLPLPRTSALVSPLAPSASRGVSNSSAPTHWFPRLLWAAAVLLACLAQGTPASASSFATTAVGKQTQPLSFTVTMSASGIATPPQALTQGIAGLDFTVAAGGTCAANASYVSGQQCTVNVVFAPQSPGLRIGAVVLTSTDGVLLGSA